MQSSPPDDTPRPAPERPEPTVPRNRRRRTIWAIAAVIVAAAIITPITVWALHDSGPDTFPIAGTIGIKGSTTSFSTPTGFECEGYEGYDDIGATSGVTVKDAGGTLIAKGHMTGSTEVSGSCLLDFSVPDVPAGKQYYLVEMAHRGELSYTEDEARGPLSLSLGS